MIHFPIGPSFPFFGTNELDQNEFLMPFQQTVGTSSSPTGRRWVTPCDGKLEEVYVQLSSPILVDASFVIRQRLGSGPTVDFTVTVPAGETETIAILNYFQARGCNTQVINITEGGDHAVTVVVTLRFMPVR